MAFGAIIFQKPLRDDKRKRINKHTILYTPVYRTHTTFYYIRV